MKVVEEFIFLDNNGIIDKERTRLKVRNTNFKYCLNFTIGKVELRELHKKCLPIVESTKKNFVKTRSQSCRTVAKKTTNKATKM